MHRTLRLRYNSGTCQVHRPGASEGGRNLQSDQRKLLALILCVALFNSAHVVLAANVAVIDTSNASANAAAQWCQLLQSNGHQCTVFPHTGATTAELAPFGVIIDLSDTWADPDGVLADAMRARKGVITWGTVPDTLQVYFNPTVQAWIGANSGAASGDPIVNTASDPVLGNRPPGTVIGQCWEPCNGVSNTSGHPAASTLAVFASHPEHIAILRNTWEGGQSAYLSDYASSDTGMIASELSLDTMAVLSKPIPATSPKGLTVIVVLLALSDAIVLRRQHHRWGVTRAIALVGAGAISRRSRDHTLKACSKLPRRLRGPRFDHAAR